MGLWITIGVLLFAVGSIMALQPSAKQKARGKLRERGRILGLQPKLVPCPDWLINQHGEKGQGMVPLYGIVLPDAKLPMMHALVIDDVIEVLEGDISLADQPCDIKRVLGITMQANFIGVYWSESIQESNKSLSNVSQLDKKLENIKENLQMWAKKVQARHI